MKNTHVCVLHFDFVRITHIRVRYRYENRDVLVPMLHRVKVTKCEMYGSATKLITALEWGNAVHFNWLWPELFRLLLGTPGLLMIFFLLEISSGVVWKSRDLQLHATRFLLSPRLCLFIVLKRNLFVYRHDSLTS